MDMAASVQLVLEEIMIKICKYIKQKYKIDNLCLAGGVALNCVANGKIVKEKIFKTFGFSQHLVTQAVHWGQLCQFGMNI